MRRPPRSTPFPTRRSSDLPGSSPPWGCRERMAHRRPGWPRSPRPPRSEEHTSELQSLRHLVCRLLLEKKKKQKRDNNWHHYREVNEDHKHHVETPTTRREG